MGIYSYWIKKRNKRSRSRSESVKVKVDRFSSLSDEILEHIISFLPIPSDASTSRILLSKSLYFRLWIQSPHLCFFYTDRHLLRRKLEYESKYNNEHDDTRIRILKHHLGHYANDGDDHLFDSPESLFTAYLHKIFSLRDDINDKNIALDTFRVSGTSLILNAHTLISWITYASSHNIHHLDLCLRRCTGDLPFSFFDTLFHQSPSLQTLKLNFGCKYFKLPPMLKVTSNLRVLHLRQWIIPGRQIGLLLSACHALEELTIDTCRPFGMTSKSEEEEEEDHFLCISSTKLSMLLIKLTFDNSIANRYTKLYIGCPNLQLFDITAAYYPPDIFQGDMPSLVKANISLPCVPPPNHIPLHIHFVAQLFQSVRNAAELTFRAKKFWLSGVIQPNWNLFSFHALRSLDLDSCFHCYHIEAITFLLGVTPNLNFLKISPKIECACPDHGIHDRCKPRRLPRGFFDELKQVIFDDSILDTINDVKSKRAGKVLKFPYSCCSNVGEFVEFLSMNVRDWEQIEKKYFKYLKCEKEKWTIVKHGLSGISVPLN